MSELYPYQEIGVQHLLSRPYALLADGMGLGKTIQAIEAVNRIPDTHRVLIVCPSTVKYNWAIELKVWDKTGLPVTVIEHKKDPFPEHGIVIISWWMMSERRRDIRGRVWDVCILDEAHRIKSPGAKRTKFFLASQPTHGIAPWCRAIKLLTGTPVLNKPLELFPILKALAPDVIEGVTDLHAYGMRYCGGRKKKIIRRRRDGTTYEIEARQWNYDGASNLGELNQRLRPFMLRRVIEDVAQELPPVVQQRIMLKGVDLPENLEELPLSSAVREIGLAKLPHIINHLKELIVCEEKIVAFVHHRDIIEAIHSQIKNSVVVYGGMSSVEKQESIDRFVNEPGVGLFIGQIQASGEGVNGLQTVCNHLVFCEFNWSPGVMDQAIARLHRLKQTKTVFVQFLVADTDLEHAMLGTVDYKRRAIEQIVTQPYEETDMSLESKLDKTNKLLERIIELSEQQLGQKEGTPVGPAPAPQAVAPVAPAAPQPPVAPAPVAALQPPAPPAAPVIPTHQELIDAAAAFVMSAGADQQQVMEAQARQIIQSFGSQVLAEIPEASRAEAIRAFQQGGVLPGAVSAL